jgi:hypothetical protein
MNIRTRLTILLTFAALVIVGAAGNPARASLAPENPVVTASGSDFTYTYDASLSSAEKVTSGDFLTIGGIDDYVAGSAFSAPGFTSTAVTTGGVTDITWQATTSSSGPETFDFGFLSTSDLLQIGTYAYADHSMHGQVLTGSGTVQVPATPEPGSFLSLGLSALVVLAMALLGRRRHAGVQKGALEAFA